MVLILLLLCRDGVLHAAEIGSRPKDLLVLEVNGTVRAPRTTE